MSIENARDLLIKALAELDVPPVTSTGSSTLLRAGANVQAAVDAAKDGDTLLLENGVTYQVGELVIRNGIKLAAQNSPLFARVGLTTYGLPRLIGGGNTVTFIGTHGTLTGIDVRSTNPDATLVTDLGINTNLLQVLAIGTIATGQHRGIAANGQGLVVTKSHIDQCWRPGQDAQALAGWDGTADLTVQDCYLGGGAQSVMFGGADPKDATRSPKNVRIFDSTLSKNPTWYTLGAQIKTALELKNVTGFEMRRCVLEYAGISAGQGAYLIVLTPRNQDGGAPYSVVKDVLIQDVTARHGGGCVNALGRDYTYLSGRMENVVIRNALFDDIDYLSGRMENVVIRNVLFDDIDPRGITKGSGRMFLIGDGPKALTIENVTVRGQNLSSSGYFYGAPPTALVMRNLNLPASLYGWFVDGRAPGLAEVRKYAPDALIDTSPGTGASGTP